MAFVAALCILSKMARRLVSKRRQTANATAQDPLLRLRQMRPVAVRLPVSFAEALTAYTAEQRRDNRSRRHRVNRAWIEALDSVLGAYGRDYGGRSQVQTVANGLVKVGVDSPALAHELGVVNRRALLERLQELLKGLETIVDLTVRVVSSGMLTPMRPERFVVSNNTPETESDED
ncbi:MAG: hypothetical protein IT462_04970 [Planctomycetes bacterium]|nr:hypothetical protein [Planctomycetota bacterium]